MAESNSCVSVQHQMEHREADQRTSAYNHRLLPLYLQIIFIKYFEYTRRGAGQQLRINMLNKPSSVHQSQTICIFCRIYALNDLSLVLVDSFWHWKLHQNGRDTLVFIQLVNHLYDFACTFFVVFVEVIKLSLLFAETTAYLFEKMIFSALGHILDKLMQVKLDAYHLGQIYLLLDVGERGCIESNVDDMELWESPFLMLAVEP